MSCATPVWVPDGRRAPWLEGRIFDFMTPLTDSTLILGVLAMITGEVFAMGLRLKKDQELTI